MKSCETKINQTETNETKQMLTIYSFIYVKALLYVWTKYDFCLFMEYKMKKSFSRTLECVLKNAWKLVPSIEQNYVTFKRDYYLSEKWKANIYFNQINTKKNFDKKENSIKKMFK